VNHSGTKYFTLYGSDVFTAQWHLLRSRHNKLLLAMMEKMNLNITQNWQSYERAQRHRDTFFTQTVNNGL